MKGGITNLYSRATFCILDEADRMLDLGFAPYVESILSHIRPDCQKALLSATWPAEVESLSAGIMRAESTQTPLFKLQIGSSGLCSSHNVEQLFRFPGDSSQKLPLLRKFISQKPGGPERVLVFVSRKDTCKELTRELCRMFDERTREITCIHGDMKQADRTGALTKFRRSQIKVCVVQG